jgi:hydrogenase expression/formation protein HypE
MRRLIKEIFVDSFAMPDPRVQVGLADMDDGAVIRLGDQNLVITTDSYVVKPLFFPGGNIGRVAVSGTVNDLAMMGGVEVLGLTLSVVIEEGFSVGLLTQIRDSIVETGKEAGVCIVTGDTKVMGKGEIDGLILTTSGVALARQIVRDNGLKPGDRILVTGTLGDHGFAVMAARHGLALESPLQSDVAPLGGLVRTLLEAGGADVVALKDPTRGGLASALSEMAGKAGVGVVLDEAAIPIRPEVRAVSELIGIDPLLVANEGKAVVGVRPQAAERILAALRAHPLGQHAAIIGTCTALRPGSLILDTGFGRRLLAEPDGELLPRIC